MSMNTAVKVLICFVFRADKLLEGDNALRNQVISNHHRISLAPKSSTH